MSIQRKMPPPPRVQAWSGNEGLPTRPRARASGDRPLAVYVAAAVVIAVLEHYSPPICITAGLLAAGMQYLGWERRWRDLIVLFGVALIPLFPSLYPLLHLVAP